MFDNITNQHGFLISKFLYFYNKFNDILIECILRKKTHYLPKEVYFKKINVNLR